MLLSHSKLIKRLNLSVEIIKKDMLLFILDDDKNLQSKA